MTRTVPLVTGEVYHIYNRGSRKADIFFDDYDYRRWEEVLWWCLRYSYTFSSYKFRLKQARSNGSEIRQVLREIDEQYRLDKSPLKILGYVWMPNHFHLVVKQLIDGGISKLMHRIGGSYSKYINEKYQMSGSLFQGRYQAVLVQTDEQLKQLFRYVHVNPLVAGLVEKEKLLSYVWSSLPYFIQKEKNKLITNSMLLDYFDGDRERLFDFTLGEFTDTDVDLIKNAVIDDDFQWYRDERRVKKEILKKNLSMRV